MRYGWLWETPRSASDGAAAVKSSSTACTVLIAGSSRSVGTVANSGERVGGGGRSDPFRAQSLYREIELPTRHRHSPSSSRATNRSRSSAPPGTLARMREARARVFAIVPRGTSEGLGSPLLDAVSASRGPKGGELSVQGRDNQLHRMARYLPNQSFQSLVIELRGGIIQQ